MTSIARSPKQITVYYDPDSCRCGKVMALLRTQGLPIQEVDITLDPLTEEQIFEIATMLNLPISELVNRDHPVFMKRFGDSDFSDEDWAKMIHNNPQIMKTPIVIHGDKAFLIGMPSEALKV
jgi:arsenate reductase